jgi:hypothetical protein
MTNRVLMLEESFSVSFLVRLAPVFAVLALVGCVQSATGPGPAPYAPYSRDDNGNIRDRGDDSRGGADM